MPNSRAWQSGQNGRSSPSPSEWQRHPSALGEGERGPRAALDAHERRTVVGTFGVGIRGPILDQSAPRSVYLSLTHIEPQ